MADGSTSFSFPKTHRLSGRLNFARVFESGKKVVRGPLVVFLAANGLSHSRLGLSVSRRVGTAVKRNRIKRLLRESFRLLQHELPGGYDLVIVVRAHEVKKLVEYQELLRGSFANYK